MDERARQHWIPGTMPPSPNKLRSTILKERQVGDLTEQEVLLEFGPGYKDQLNITLLIPPGEGPFPVLFAPGKKIGMTGCRLQFEEDI